MWHEDLDFDALISQFWGSEANLQAFLDSETRTLCLRICGPDAPIPKVKVTYSPLKAINQDGTRVDVAVAGFAYRGESDLAPATILIPAVIAGNRPRLPHFIAFALIRHWEALGSIGETAFDYPEEVEAMINEACLSIPEHVFKGAYSPQFVARAIKVARDLEIPLRDFLFPRMSLSVYPPPSEEGRTEST